jgi:predicted nucleotidyltransferase
MRPIPRLSRAAARAAAERAAQVLGKDPRVRLVYLFGSVTDPERDEVRDVDLAVLCDPPLSTDELLRLRADAAEAAGAVIDLVSLNHASVVLAWEVTNGGACVYASSPDTETDFVTRARSRYWDFQPFLKEQWRLAGERLQERRRGPQA